MNRITPTVVTIGTFDGIHLGHRALLERTRQLARTRGLRSLVLTFPRPPQNYLGRPKRLLMPKEKRLARLGEYVDHVIVIDFPEIQGLSPQAFAQEILKGRLKAAAVVVGENFRFGRDRRGDVRTLRDLGEELGFEVEVLRPVRVEGEWVSSTAIRRALQSGEVERAARLLGEPPRLWGRVVRGSGRGHTLGFPTANLSVDPELILPAEGVYASRVDLHGKDHPGALYIGHRPTLDGKGLSIEVHILREGGKELDLYGQELEVELLSRIRADRRFLSLDELRRQIEADIEAVRSLFARLSG